MEKIAKDIVTKMEVSNTKKRGRPCGPAGTRTFYQVDTKGICLLCLKDRHCSNKKGGQEASAQFCRVLLRYLNLDFHKNIVKPSNFKWKVNRVKKVGVELCQDCSLLADSFKEMYCQMELIQMRLNAYIRTISDIMRTAGRIPSRVKTYQQRMGIVSKGGPGCRMRPSLSTPKVATLAQIFRKELIQRTFEKHKRTFPRVVLDRNVQICSADSSQRILKKTSGTILKLTHANDRGQSKILPLSHVQMQFKNFLLGYALSFAIVLLLNTLAREKLAPDQNGGPVNSGNVSTINATEEIVDPENDKCLPVPFASNNIPENDKSVTKQKEIRKNSITITDSGKTVLLPHQSFKTDEEFVDESIMEYEETADLIDISDDGFFTHTNGMSDVDDRNMANTNGMIEQETVKQEPQESVVEVNDRFCNECRIHLSCRAELEKHRSLIHKWSNHVQCPTCKNMFSSYHFLKMHRKDSESCSLDEAMEALEFATVAKPVFPYSSTVKGNRFCPMEGCFEVFLKPENLKLHLKAHGLFSCSQDTCKEKFDKAHDLALHESQQHSTGQFSGYKCTRCNFHVGGQYQYILHFLVEHLKINIFSEQCSICRKGFVGKGTLTIKEVHFRTHHDVKGKDPKSIVKCDVDDCEAFFLKKQQLTAHKTHIHHIEQDTKMNCSICGEKMLNRLVLIRHKLQAHSNLPEHEIEAKLKRSLCRSSKKGKYDCMYCGNQYSTKFSLLLHSKVHDDLKNAALDEEERKRLKEEARKNGESAQSAVPMEKVNTDSVQTIPPEDNSVDEVIDLS